MLWDSINRYLFMPWANFLIDLMPTMPTHQSQWDAVFNTFAYVNLFADLGLVFTACLALITVTGLYMSFRISLFFVNLVKGWF